VGKAMFTAEPSKGVMNPASTAIRSTIRFSVTWIEVSGVRHIPGASEGNPAFSADNLLLLLCFTIYITDQQGHYLSKGVKNRTYQEDRKCLCPGEDFSGILFKIEQLFFSFSMVD
jgi:hypothetical protein